MVKLTFVGDIMALLPQNKASYNRFNNEYDYNPIFNKIAPILKTSDYVIGNLETPIAGENLKYTYQPSVFNTPIEFAQAVKNAGISFVSTANNHCLDRGIEGLYNTIDNLNSIGLDFSGTYKSNEESDSVFIKDIKGLKVAILAYTYGTNSEWQNNELPCSQSFIVDLFRRQDKYIERGKDYLRPIKKVAKLILPQRLHEILRRPIITDCVIESAECDDIYLSKMEDKLRYAKKNADLVVMYMHSGGQFNSKIGQYTQNLANRIISNNPNIIIGSHPHCVLKYVIKDHIFAAYSLGNFCFTPKYGNYCSDVYADYSVVINAYIETDTKVISKISYYITKVVKDEYNNYVVYHVKDLCNASNKKERVKIQEDCNRVARRFTGERSSSYDVTIYENFIY